VLTIGGCDMAVREALEVLEARGRRGDFLRVRGFPFGEEVERFLAEHEVVYVVEQNRDAQLRSLLLLETKTPKEKLRSIRAYGGFPLQASQVVKGVEEGKS
jgi:2-oxoglutarate/2-oxoacid ferredoxin oxidoreductase subunit alpha